MRQAGAQSRGTGDQQHLDIAAGTGEPGLTIAKLAPKGHVVLTDLAAEMLDIATRRVKAQGIRDQGVQRRKPALRRRDLRQYLGTVRIPVLPDIAKATAEFARVLKPGGRLCSSVWVKPEENPWTSIALQAVATEAVLVPPEKDGFPASPAASPTGFRRFR